MPLQAKERDLFYLRPFDKVAKPSEPWYYYLPLGVHKLSGMVKEMFSAVGIDGKTNHSLRAASASALFEATVPEKVIQERTGHRSVKAVRLYEHTTSKQHEDVCKILMDRTNTSVVLLYYDLLTLTRQIQDKYSDVRKMIRPINTSSLIKDYDGTDYTLSEEDHFRCMLHPLQYSPLSDHSERLAKTYRLTHTSTRTCYCYWRLGGWRCRCRLCGRVDVSDKIAF